MSGGSRGSEQVVQRQTSDPPAYLLPYLEATAKGGKGLLDSGALRQAFSPYPGATYIPPTAAAMMGLGQMRNTAQNGPDLGNYMMSNLGRMGNLAQGSQDVSLTQPGMGNPYLVRNLQTAADKAQHAMSTQFGAMGRYGGAAPTGVMGREIGNLWNEGLGNQMNLDMDRLMQGQALNAANRAGAINSYAQMAPMVDQSRYWNAEKLINIGDVERGEAQTELEDYMNRWQQTQRAPLDQWNWFNNLINGMTSTGGTSTTFAPRGSPWSGLLGAGLGGLGLLGSFL